MCHPNAQLCTHKLLKVPTLLQYQSDVTKAGHPETAAAGRNPPEPFPWSPPSPASQDWSCLHSLTFQLCPTHSVYMSWCTQESQALTQAKLCTATATPWGLSPGRTRQACSPKNISHEFPKCKNTAQRPSGGASLLIPPLLPKDYSPQLFRSLMCCHLWVKKCARK